MDLKSNCINLTITFAVVNLQMACLWEKLLITTSNCDVDSSHEFQDGSPNPLEHFKVSALMRQFQIQGIVPTF